MATRHLTATEVAERLHVTVGALYQMRWRGTAPQAVKRPGHGRGRKLLFPLANVEKWERENTA